MARDVYTDVASGRSWPLREASEDYTFKVYKSDRRKAVIGSTSSCLIALGLKHDRNVAHVFLGSSKDAYVVFRGKGRMREYAKHYVILAKAGRVRDIFDQKGSPDTQVLTLSAPTAGRTLAARDRLNKRRRAEIKAGSPVKKRDKPNRPRIVRLGVPPRPRAVVTKGEWTIPERGVNA